MEKTQNRRKRDTYFFGVMVAVLIVLVPLATLANPGVPSKWVGLKLIVSEATWHHLFTASCDNLTAYKSSVMTTYIYDKNDRPICGANGAPVNMANSKEAINPTWEQLVYFLKCDDTDKQQYIDDKFNCVDYAEMLQNDATKAGWKAAIVGIHLYDDFTDNVTGHAINAFQTTDRGLVYIDSTRSKNETARDVEKLVKVEVGKQYKATYVFPSRIWPLFLDRPNNYTVRTIDFVAWPLTDW
jgi:hypothetical protein